MSDSNWRIRDTIVVSLVGFFFVCVLAAAVFATGYSKAQHRAEAQNYSNQHNAEAQRRSKDCFSRGDAAVGECIEIAKASARDAERAEQELNAQRDMAEWAFWLLVVSAFGLVLTTIGTIFLAWQMILTRKAVKETGDATQAMVRQNELTEIAQRPWIRVKLEQIEIIPLIHKNAVYTVQIWLSGKNFGSRPASLVDHKVKLLVAEKSKSVDIMPSDFEAPHSKDSMHLQVMYPNEKGHVANKGLSMFCDLGREMKEAIENKSGKRLYVKTQLTYRSLDSEILFYVSRLFEIKVDGRDGQRTIQSMKDRGERHGIITADS